MSDEHIFVMDWRETKQLSELTVSEPAVCIVRMGCDVFSATTKE